jgi:hypothetical protein
MGGGVSSPAGLVLKEIGRGVIGGVGGGVMGKELLDGTCCFTRNLQYNQNSEVGRKNK